MQYNEEVDYTAKFDAGLWKRIIKYARPFYKYLVGVICVMLVTSFIDVVFPMMTRTAIDTFIAGQTLDGIVPFALLYSALVLVQVACIFLFIRWCDYTAIHMGHYIRKIGFKKMQELPFSFYDKTPVGFIMARLTSDTNRLSETIGWMLVDLCWGGFYLIFVTIVMLRTNLTLGLMVVATLPVLVVICYKFQKHIINAYRTVRKTNSQITGAFNEGIMGAKTSKTLVREDRNTQEFKELTGEMRRSSIRAAVLSAFFMPLVVSLGSIATAAVIWKGGYDVVTGAITLGTLTMFVSYAMQFFEPVRNIAGLFAELQSSQAAAERVMSLLETQPEIADSKDIEQIYGDNFNPRRENWPEITGDVTFENVSFQYKDGAEVLKDFSLQVKSGQTIALVGETGSGKSTIVNLICRFYEPTGGRILIDSVDYKQRSQLWLQSNLGYVLQSPHLFSGTIRDNIRYGKLDATDAETEAAAQLVNAEEFILKFEKGYDTDVGEGGNRLSTGQKQLISFARAILANPKIFVLDEATSSVDTETEQMIQRAIHVVLQSRTSFIIAHRLSTVRSADRILVIENGTVIEDGTHKQLIAQRGHYYNLYTNQFKDEREQDLLKAENVLA